MTGAAVEVRRNGILNLSALGAEAAGMLVAYMESLGTKTSYGEADNRFSWLGGDEIDAVVTRAQLQQMIETARTYGRYA